MPITFRRPGWTTAVFDTIDEKQLKRKECFKVSRRNHPIIFETTVNGRPSRLRGVFDEDGVPYDVYCEYLYRGAWRELLNNEIIYAIKDKYIKEVGLTARSQVQRQTD